MDYFECAYFLDTYFDTPNCGAATGGKGGRGPYRRRVLPPEPPVLDDGEELFALF